MPDAKTSQPQTVPAWLGYDIAQRQRDRADRVLDQWGALTPREQILVREAASMGFAQGQRYGSRPTPPDPRIVEAVLDATNAFADLYPTLAGLGRREGGSDV